MNLTKVSKFLSLVLRHKPEAARISLDEHGWAYVNSLVHGVSLSFPGFDKNMLEEIVRTDEKQRYSFNEDGSKIRANQGHSIPVDVELDVVEPPVHLYHGTGEKRAVNVVRESRRNLNESIKYVKETGDTIKRFICRTARL